MGGYESRRAVGFPAETTSFVDRRHEAAEAKRLLSVSRLLTLTGPGGVGKTRLAARVAAQLSRAFPDGVWLVPLAALQDEGLVPHTVAAALGIRDERGGRPMEALIEYLRDRRLLLVLDNCEHLPQACAVLAAAVLAAARGVRILATSRHRLGLTEEHLLDVPPLPSPDPEELAGPGVPGGRYPALDLFADRAAAVVPGFTITAENQQAVARLCRRLDGLPLAIELAAVRMRALGVDQLLERLDDRYRLLTGGSPAVPPRHQTLRSTVDWSHGLCTPQEQLVWARLSVLVGGFDLDAAEAVCADERLGRCGVFEAVAGLVDKSVLIREAGTDGRPVRYRLLGSLRDYGLEKLSGLGEAAMARRRHCDYFLRLAGGYEKRWFGPGQSEAVARLRAEQDNLRGALDFCLSTEGEAQSALHLAGTLWFYWSVKGAWGEGRYWLDQAIRAGAQPTGARAKALWLGGLLALINGRSTALLALEEAAGRERQPGDDLPVAVAPLDLAPARSRDGGEMMTFAILTRVELACTLVFHGRPERAVPLCAQARAVCEAHGEQWALSYVLRILALAQWALGDPESAAGHARAALRLKHLIRDTHGLGRVLDILALIAVELGAVERSAVLLGAVARLRRETGRSADESGSRAERQTRQALGECVFRRAFRYGAGLSQAEAVAYALEEAPPPAADPRPRNTGSANTAQPAAPGLTRRETQVAELIARGLTNKQIAETLVIARRTAEGHVERILNKLGFGCRSQVAAWITSGVVPERSSPSA